MSTENDTKTEPRRTVAALIEDAVRTVNWTPIEGHTQQARYDAAKALSSIYAYWTTVAMETLRRIDPEAAEHVAGHIDDDLGWADAHEHAYGWEQALAAGNPIPADAWPFFEILGRPNTQPAGEQHTGTLNLTGEGNAADDRLPNNIPPEAVEAATRAHIENAGWDWSDLGSDELEHEAAKAVLLADMRIALRAAAPAIRQQAAEEIAVALEAETEEMPNTAEYAARIARKIGGTA